MRVVLDTNVFVSGIFWSGSSNQVILSWKGGRFILITSLVTISEIAKTLKDFKIRLSDDMIDDWIALIMKNSDIVESVEEIDIIDTDPTDNIFLEAAIAGDADFIVSQDKHLLKLKEYRGIRIISPEKFNKISEFF